MKPNPDPYSTLPRHAWLLPDVWQAAQERQRIWARLFIELGWLDLSHRRAVEVGCGVGGHLLELLRMGFMPRNLKGIESDEDCHARACKVLPSSLRLLLGDALGEEAQRVIGPLSQDIVMQCNVFSRIPDEGLQTQLADALWRWVRPGGGVLWYDSTVAHPHDHTVQGVPIERVQKLFPQARLRVRTLTLNATVARWACRRNPSLYHLFNAVPGLRTHAVVWAEKTEEAAAPTRLTA